MQQLAPTACLLYINVKHISNNIPYHPNLLLCRTYIALSQVSIRLVYVPNPYMQSKAQVPDGEFFSHYRQSLDSYETPERCFSTSYTVSVYSNLSNPSLLSSTHSSSTRRKILSGNMPDSCPEIITDWTYIPLTKANEKSKLTQTCSMTWNIFHLSASLHRSFLDHLRQVAIIYFNCVSCLDECHLSPEMFLGKKSPSRQSALERERDSGENLSLFFRSLSSSSRQSADSNFCVIIDNR